MCRLALVWVRRRCDLFSVRLSMSIRRYLRLVVFAVGLFAALAMVVTAQVMNELRDTMSTSRAQAEGILDSYFAAMKSQDFSNVPFTPDAVFVGSLHTEPIKGDSAVRTFLVAVDKGACVHYEYQMNAGAVVPVVACFRFKAGRIAEERAFFDPRPFLTPRSSGNDGSGPK